MNFVSRFINGIREKERSRKHGYPFYYINRFCRRDGCRFVVDGVGKSYDESTGFRYINRIYFKCPVCGNEDYEDLHAKYVDAQLVIDRANRWLSDDCPVLDSWDML